MFKPKAIYFENKILEYPLGKELMEKYKEIPKIEIENHNNIEEMRKKENKEFPNMKRNLIIGIRKTHKFVENHKTSDYLVPYTSSGCTASCMYCYLVCNYNKCAYLRLFVNREQMLEEIIKTSEKADRDLTFEIGSNSDLVLENTITGNLPWTIENFKNASKGYLTFPTKFDMIDDLLTLDHQGRVIIRMSVNPEEIINKVEFGTSRLKGRIEAINKLKEAGYKIGILIAPVILVDNWKQLYSELIKRLNEELSQIEQHHLKTIYIGGGTPSALNDEQLEKLMSMLKPYSLEVEEYCMEVNPESMDYYKLKILKKGGINRLSIGVQTFQNHLLKEIERHHNTIQVKNIIKYAKEIGFDNISIDLMYGLPKQTKEDIQKDIEVLKSLDLQHVSYYSLILEEGTILKYKNYQPLDEESEYQLTLFIDQELEKIGFEKYEISNYAKQGYQSKHNLMYWYYNNYYGIGLGACSKIDGQIIEHSRSLTKYLNGDFKTTTIDETKEETMFNQIMMSLRLKEGLDLNKFKERYQEDARILYKEAITRNIEKGRLMIENDYLKATQEGQYVLNDILIDFM